MIVTMWRCFRCDSWRVTALVDAQGRLVCPICRERVWGYDVPEADLQPPRRLARGEIRHDAT